MNKFRELNEAIGVLGAVAVALWLVTSGFAGVLYGAKGEVCAARACSYSPTYWVAWWFLGAPGE